MPTGESLRFALRQAKNEKRRDGNMMGKSDEDLTVETK